MEFGAKHLLCLESEDIPASGTVVARFAVSQDEQGKFTAPAVSYGRVAEASGV